MDYRILGRTEIKVSVIGIGGEGLESRNDQEIAQMIDYAISQKINFFDIYNANPKVRRNMGSLLSNYPRASYIIQGHLGTTWDDGQYRRTREIKEVRESYDDLLKQLKVDYIDVGMIHYVDHEEDFKEIFNGEIIEYAKKLKAQGKIRCLGISTHNTEIAFKAVASGIIDVILFSVNPAYDMLPPNDDLEVFLDDRTFKKTTYEGIDKKRDELYRVCENKGIALTVMKGYGGGILLSDNQSPFEKALTPVQCIHYALNRPAVASVMVGVSDKKEIKAALAYLKADEGERNYSQVLANAPKTSFHGRCMYCGHCAPCSSKIDIALVNKYLDLAVIQDELTETLKNHYELLKYHASDCIECGKCLENCPFQVDIISKMKEAIATFGY